MIIVIIELLIIAALNIVFIYPHYMYNMSFYVNYKLMKQIKKKYNELNVGDNIYQKFNYNLIDPPWSGTMVQHAKITKKGNKWVEIKYDDGRIENIKFNLSHIITIDCWKKTI